MQNLIIRVILAILFAVALAAIYTVSSAHSNDASAVKQANEQFVKPANLSSGHTLAISDDAFIITNGVIIDGSGADPIPNGLVAIQGNHILAAGSAADFTIPAGAEVIDAGGGTIMPGIINAHVHNTHTPGTRHRFLVNGVTAMCDLATSLNDMPQFEQSYTDQNQPAGRGFYSGPMITAPGGYPSSYGFSWDYEVASPTEAQAAVVNILSLGADMIKIALEPWQPQEPWPVLSLEQVEAIVSAAHVRGVPVRAHIQQATMLDIALKAGVDAVEHVPLPFAEEAKLKQMTQEDTLSLADFPEFETQLTRMASQGVVLVPTLSVGTCATYKMPGLESETQRRMCNFQLEIVGRFYDLGGVVALGNDYGNLGVERGMPLREMQLLLAAGLSPMSVIEAGTRHAAQVCGHGDELGTLGPGKLADIIVLAGDPLIEIEAMGRLSLVIKDGEVVYTIPHPTGL
jgi:imidazolonepropionase-like amidohydrolase